MLGPGAVIEALAKEHSVSPADVIACLPEGQAVTIPGDRFEEVMGEISHWGDITLIVHTDDVILEARGPLPEGSMARGYYNLHGKPIGGHLKAGNCASISFVSRLLFDKQTHSVQFYNETGGCMFKIYLGRNDDGEIIAGQLETYQNHRCRLSGAVNN